MDIRTQGKRWLLVGMIMGLSACASQPQTPDTSQAQFNHELYDGKPSLALDNDFPPATAEEAIARGDKAYREGNPDLALYQYIRSLAFEESSHQADALYKIGYIHEQRGNQPLARKAYEQAKELQPDNINVLSALGQIYMKDRNYVQAETLLLQVIGLDQQRMGNAQAIVEGYKLDLAATRVDAKSPLSAYSTLAIRKDLLGEYPLAQHLYQQILSVKPDSVATQINLGYSYYLAGNLRRAEYHVREAINLAPDNTRGWSNLALIYVRDERYDEAVNALARVMPRHKALNDVGYFAMLAQDYEVAVNFLEQAIDASPTYYGRAVQNLERARNLLVEHPPVRLTKEMRGQESSQATLYRAERVMP